MRVKMKAKLLWKKNPWIYLLAAVAIICIVLVIVSSKKVYQPVCNNGFLDLSNWNFDKSGNVRLDGEWEFYSDKLLTPEDFKGKTLLHRQYIKVPSRWVSKDPDISMKDDGVGTYRLKIKINKDTGELGIKTTNIRLSYKIYVDGKETGVSGNPAASRKEGYVPLNIPKAFFFSPDENSHILEIIIQVANLDYYSGGIVQSIYLGNQNDILFEYIKSIMGDILVISFLILTGIYYFAIYIKTKEDKKLVYIVVLCIAFTMIVATGNAKVFFFFIHFIPYIKAIKIKIAFIAVCTIFIILFIRAMSRELISLVIVRGLIGTMSVAIAVMLVTPDNSIVFFEKVLGSIYVITYFYLGFLLIKAIVLKKHDKADKKAVIFMLFIILQFANQYIVLNLYYFSIIRNFKLTDNLLFIVLLVGLSFMFSDQFMKAYQDIQWMNSNLIAADKIKDEFLVYTSNEFKTPLNIIKNITQSLLSQNEKFVLPEDKDNLLYIMNISTRLSSMVNNIIDFENLKNNKLKLSKKDIDVHGMVRVVLDVIRCVKPDKQIEFINDIPADTYFVYSDESRMEQILFNLVENALKYTDNGFIRISAQEAGLYIILRVWDSGKGIDETVRDGIFDEYLPDISEGYESSISAGMGLSISKLLAFNMGGDLSLEWSELNNGSIFMLKLPKAENRKKEQRSQSPLWKKRLNREFGKIQNVVNTELTIAEQEPLKENYNSLKPKVLLVDDDTYSIKLLYDVFKEDFEPLTANTGEKAMELVHKYKDIDLILLDTVMPGISGYEVCKNIRSQYALFDMPILLMTIRNSPEDIEAGLESGANDILVKPFNSKELITRVKTLRKMKEAMQEAIHIETIFLQSQIKQHFLYNSLSSIVSLCYSNSERAGDLLGDLSNYLRCILEIDPHHSYISLEREISLLKSYIELEKARFGERLTVKMEFDKDILNVQIPAFIIQPIVENAIRHGIMKRITGGTVEIYIIKEIGKIQFTIKDDGLGISKEQLSSMLKNNFGGSIGLKNVDKRLMNEYGEGLRMESSEGEGTCVTIGIPVQSYS
jgi:two-component system, sensor histidine kinase ChiS